MVKQIADDRIRGTTLRWTFTEGPQRGKSYEHTFHDDGTVSYRAIVDEPRGPSSGEQRADAAAPERPPYTAYAVSDTVHLVSYRADSGFTLTVALNFATHELVSIASNSEQWFPARGTFEELNAPTM
jgi:hypothetical protein